MTCASAAFHGGAREGGRVENGEEREDESVVPRVTGMYSKHRQKNARLSPATCGRLLLLLLLSALLLLLNASAERYTDTGVEEEEEEEKAGGNEEPRTRCNFYYLFFVNNDSGRQRRGSFSVCNFQQVQMF